MAFTKILIAVCVFAALAEGQFVFPNFGGFGPMFMKPLPVPQPPRLPGPFQPPPLPQPPLLPTFGFGYPGFFGNPPVEIGETIPGPVLEVPRSRPGRFPELVEISRDDESRGRFSGLSISSTSTGNGGMTVVTTNDNGKTQTFISPAGNREGKFYRVPASPPSTGPQAFMMPDVPEIKVPQFLKIPPINMNSKPSKFNKYQAHAVSTTLHMLSKKGEKPKIVSEVTSFTNDNGKIKKKVRKYAN